MNNYEDGTIENNQVYIYQVKTRTEGGLLSEASPVYKVMGINKSDKIRFYTKRAWGTWPFDDNSESNTYFTLDHNQPYINNINTVDAGHGVFPYCDKWI